MCNQTTRSRKVTSGDQSAFYSCRVDSKVGGNYLLLTSSEAAGQNDSTTVQATTFTSIARVAYVGLKHLQHWLGISLDLNGHVLCRSARSSVTWLKDMEFECWRFLSPYRFSIIDVCLLSLRLDGVTYWVMRSLWIWHWALVPRVCNHNQSSLLQPVDWVACCVWWPHVYHTVPHFSFLSRNGGNHMEASGRRGSGSEEIYSELTWSKYIVRAWLRFKGFVNQLFEGTEG